MYPCIQRIPWSLTPQGDSAVVARRQEPRQDHPDDESDDLRGQLLHQRPHRAPRNLGF